MFDAFFFVISTPVDKITPSQKVLYKTLPSLNNLDGATVKVWFNTKQQKDTGEQNGPSEA